MELSKKIESIKPSMLNCNVFSVYDYPNSYTVTELLGEFFKAINDCINVSNHTIDLTKWLVDEGLALEVAKKIDLWVSDGTLGGLINDKLLKDINDKVSGLKNSYIDPDDFEGTDKEKLQKAIDFALRLKKEKIIKLRRFYNLSCNESLYINRNGIEKIDGVRDILLHLVGESGGIIKNTQGYIFTSNDSNINTNEGTLEHWTGDLKLENLTINSVDGVGTIIFDGDKLIRCYLHNCEINNVDTIVKSTTYTQSYYVFNSKIRYGLGTLFDTENNYDLNIDNNIFEWNKNFFKCSGCSGGRITNNLIEGLKGFTMNLMGYQSLLVDGNYFEFNKSYINLSQGKGYGLRVSNNYFHDRDSSKVFINLPVLAYNEASFQDKYVFMSNVGQGETPLFRFSSKPHENICIISIGNVGYCENYNENIVNIGVTTKNNKTNGDIEFKNGNNTVYTKEGTIAVSSGNTTFKSQFSEKLTKYDKVSISLKKNNDFSSESISAFSVKNLVINDLENSVWVSFDSTFTGQVDYVLTIEKVYTSNFSF